MENQQRKWEETIENSRISVSSSTKPIQLGKPVVVTIVFKNDGSTNIGFPRSQLWFEYDYKVYKKDGSELALTSFGAEIMESMGFQGGTLIELAAGSETTSTVEISKLYKLMRVGSYVMMASKVIPTRDGKGFVKIESNKITIEIQ